MLAFLWLLCTTTSSLAGEIKKLELERTEAGLYLINIEMMVEASEEKVMELLTDYNHLTRLNSQILESELISEKDGVSQVRTKVRPCGYLFCKTINQVQNLLHHKDGSLSARVIPEKSDFHKGRAHWSIQTEDGSVRIKFNAALLPRFWVPPFINLWVMRRMIENEMHETIANLEMLKTR